MMKTAVTAILFAVIPFVAFASGQSYLVSSGPNAGDGYDGGVQQQYATQAQDCLPTAPQVRSSSPGTVSVVPQAVSNVMQYQVQSVPQTVEVTEQVFVPAKIRYEVIEEPVQIMVKRTVPVIEQEARIETRTVQRNICAPQVQVQQQCVQCQPQVQVQQQCVQCQPQVTMQMQAPQLQCVPQQAGMFVMQEQPQGDPSQIMDWEFTDRGRTMRVQRDAYGRTRVMNERRGLLNRLWRFRHREEDIDDGEWSLPLDPGNGLPIDIPADPGGLPIGPGNGNGNGGVPIGNGLGR